MPDALFADPRLAALYDVFDGDRGDLGLYLGVAEEFEAGHVLDVGCGTGTLAVLLAARGHRVTGVDPAAASLDVARSKPGDVTWLHGDATTLPGMSADLATMTGNVAQVFLDDDAWHATLRGVHGALRDGGVFVFETRRPHRRAWEGWAADPGPVVQHVPGIGPVEQVRAVTEVALPFVSFTYTYTFPGGGTLRSGSTLRFRDRDELERSLTATGFGVREVRDAPDRPGLEYIFVAGKVSPAGP